MKKASLLVAALALLAVLAFLARGCVTDPERPVRRPIPPAPEPPPSEPEPEPEPLPPPPEKPPPPPPEPPEPPPPRKPVEAIKAAQGESFIRGVVRYAGEKRLPRRRIRLSDPKCEDLHPGPMLSDDLVVDDEGNVKWAFVYVDRGPLEERYVPPQTAVFLNQVKCRFEPRVLGVMTGQPILIRNSDPLLHNVHALPFQNREFNFGQGPYVEPLPPPETQKVFEVAEVMVKIKCDVHPWMTAWVGVLDHPYYSVTDAKGRFSIDGLKAGRYRVRVWHERFAERVGEIDVPPDGGKTVKFYVYGLKR